MTWFKVDDNLAFHPKALAVGNQALGLWVRAGAWCGQLGTDGHVPEEMVAALGGSKTEAKLLVASRFWHVPGDVCFVCEAQGALPFEAGYQFHDWQSYQPSRLDRKRVSQARSEAGKVGGRRSGQVRRSKAEATPKQVASRLLPENVPSKGSKREPRPVPGPVSVAGQSSIAEVVGAMADDELARITALTGGDLAHARRVATFVLETAPGNVRHPIAYVMKAVNQDLDMHRYHSRPPKKGEQCPEHSGEWRDSCRPCAIDRRLEGESEQA